MRPGADPVPDVPSRLSNARSERVKAVAALGRRAVRQRQGRFVVEGPHAVRELLRYAERRVVDVYVTDAEAGTDIGAAASQAGVSVYTCTAEVVAAMAHAQHPQGVLAVAKPVDVPLRESLGSIGDGFVVVLSNVRDPGNAGTVIRAADAFGASAVLVSDASVDLYNPKVIRSTVGSLFHLPISIGSPIEEIIAGCAGAGLRVLAADGAADTMLPDVDLSTGHAWVLGNEAQGLPRRLREQCDEVVAVPLVGRAESLNLAMAATVCLHASASMRTGATKPL